MFLCLTSLFHSVLFASSKFEFSTNKPLVDFFSLISHDISQLIFNIKYSNSTNSPFRVIRGKVVWRKILSTRLLFVFTPSSSSRRWRQDDRLLSLQPARAIFLVIFQPNFRPLGQNSSYVSPLCWGGDFSTIRDK